MRDVRSTGIAVVATHPPRRCGIATFSLDLIAALRLADPGIAVKVAAIEEPGIRYSYGDDVRWRVRQGDAQSFRDLADAINESDVGLVNLQHELALYGTWADDTYDDHLPPFLDTLRKPLVTILHSVPPRPAPSIRGAIRSTARASAEIVVRARTTQDPRR